MATDVGGALNGLTVLQRGRTFGYPAARPMGVSLNSIVVRDGMPSRGPGRPKTSRRGTCPSTHLTNANEAERGDADG